MERTSKKIDKILSEIMIRKSDARKFALDNYENFGEGENVRKVNENFSDEINKTVSQMLYYLEKANERYDVSQMQPIVTNGGIIKKIFVIIKKIIRRILNRLFGWYFNAAAVRQRDFNDSCVKTLNFMKELVVKQAEENACLMREKKELEENVKKENELLEKKIDYILNKLNVSCDLELLENAPEIDYFDFENEFRGTRSDIMRSQEAYVDYFKTNGGGKILDIGCGRGEFLELMFNYGISVFGVDCYKPFVKYCSDRGFEVCCDDALTYLETLEDCSLGGIFMSQVVEHLSNDYVRALISTAYKKMKPGCCFILETPNPDCVAALTEFNIDMSHIKPVHFNSLKYLFEKTGFESVERFHNPNAFYPLQAVKIEGEGISNIDEFNKGIEYINNMLFGCRDYTLIARK